MDIPTPDSVTIIRATQSGNIYEGEEVIADNVKCIIVPDGEDTDYTIAGTIDKGNLVMICEPDYDIKAGDEVIDNNTGSRYVVLKAQRAQRNPITFEFHHQEIVMFPKPM